jgi:hypothetical protein
MNIIKNLLTINPIIKLYNKDENDREINIYKLKNCQFYKTNVFYPNVLVKNDDGIINPINEAIQSLKDISLNNSTFLISKLNKTDNNPYFFLIYNTDNYYHFIYDTLPYLISFFELKKIMPDLKLLMNYPNFQKKSHYKFVIEFLEILAITNNQIEIVDSNTLYSTIYVSNSYTHNGKSNLPPRKEVYDFYEKIVNKVKENNDLNPNLPKNIYVSRRTWINKDTSNIGTNYTTKRKLKNEDDLVDYLTKKGYKEIFTENLNTIEKILLFNNAENIIGPIGGGLCNVLFSRKKTNLKVLNSPTFFDVNKRFIYSFEKVNYDILNISSHTEVGDIKKYMRVKFDGKVGEVIEVMNDSVVINYSEIDVAGWNNEISFKKITKKISEIEKIDNGLNSEWEINLDKLKHIL